MCSIKSLKEYRNELVRSGKITTKESDEIKARATGIGILEFLFGAGFGVAIGVIITISLF